MDVAIQVPAFEEGRAMLPTLRSIRDQQVPAHVDSVSYEVWVTLSPPDKSLCSTWQAAREAAGFEPFEAPAFKLSTRNAAHDSAVERGYDAIVTWDADAPARWDRTLASVTEPLHDPGVVAVRGEPVSSWTDPFGILENLARPVWRSLRGHIHGQLSAFSAAAWQCAGPFDTGIDQTDIHAVWTEEELGFADRLRQCGEVVQAPGARVFNDSRRTACRMDRALARFGRQPNEWCAARGVETFTPDDPRRDDDRRLRR